MSIEHLLAKMTAQCPGFEIGTGGQPGITADDVRTALGIIQYRDRCCAGSVLRGHEQVPTNPETPLAIRMIEARYLDDDRSRKHAAWIWAQILYMAWWDHDADMAETISKALMTRVAYLMVSDYCVPEHARLGGDAALAKATGLAYNTWKRKMARFYGHHMRKLWSFEAPIIDALVAVLFPRKSDS